MSDDMKAADKVVALNQQCPEQALQRLNRITGLHFHSLPESLVNRLGTADNEPSSTESTKGAMSPSRPLCG